jgi:hypothetical protein
LVFAQHPKIIRRNSGTADAQDDAMFRTTALGHHCWLFSTNTTRLLVDPLLHARFGLTERVEFRAHPPRIFDFDAFPAIDAVFITHEHESHFEIPSLDLLDRRIPIYLPARSSVATRGFLCEMGFAVHLARPGERIDIGDLHLLPMTANQVRDALIEEWDDLPYLVWDDAAHGSFFSSVDMRQNHAMWRWAQTVIERPGLWAHTSNSTIMDFALGWQMPPDRSLHRYVERVINLHARMSDQWQPPAALLVVGTGWALGGELEWLNRNHIPFENDEAQRVLASLLPGERVLAPLPGTTIAMERGRIEEIEAETPFVRTAPRSQWPSRAYTGDVYFLQSYSPVTGLTTFPAGQEAALRRELDGFAAYLYASPPFRRLYSLTKDDLRGRKPTFAFVLRADAYDGAFVLEYEPQSCSFVPVECAQPTDEYLAVFECWATDMLAFLRGELSSASLVFGRHRQWNGNPDAFDFTVSNQLFEYMHPLRHPQRFLTLYRKTLAGLQPAPEGFIAFAERTHNHEGDSHEEEHREAAAEGPLVEGQDRCSLRGAVHHVDQLT